MSSYVFGFGILKQFLFGIAFGFGNSVSLCFGIFNLEIHPSALKDPYRVWFSFCNEWRKDRQ